MKTTPRHVEVLYCDDIREEVGNKFSYMGVYSSELLLQNAPVILPKLCVVVRVVTDMQDPFESLEIRIVRVKDDVELDTVGKTALPAPDKSILSSTMPKLIANVSFILAPFQIDGEFLLRVKAITEREEIRGSGLHIRIAAPQIDAVSKK